MGAQTRKAVEGREYGERPGRGRGAQGGRGPVRRDAPTGPVARGAGQPDPARRQDGTAGCRPTSGCSPATSCPESSSSGRRNAGPPRRRRPSPRPARRPRAGASEGALEPVRRPRSARAGPRSSAQRGAEPRGGRLESGHDPHAGARPSAGRRAGELGGERLRRPQPDPYPVAERRHRHDPAGSRLRADPRSAPPRSSDLPRVHARRHRPVPRRC